MKMKPLMSSLFVLSFISMVLLLLLQSSTVMSVDCNVLELISCTGPISTGETTPDSVCCSKLKEHEPCFCQYKNNPFYSSYVNSPNATKVAETCGVSFPSC
ncbi:Bifunctional inhibitor/lipid-transfer protein/seed storage 2S albumin protein [Dioscorea alata]|uniref:Bifunctional inhibitor/lipid-transfer protein/seed storage 2S albumin protein n=1 Tax=Dioscorea alata TaxID=55571 RepID=A0ACB7UDQ4_DIOAL|nr:Bifunctional inhibitor/lipid-transfer protein/seed storage 2S albumin protein [Dioscorea alata]